MNGKKVTLLTSIGAGLEFYDFIIYAMLADFISHLFFPHEDHFAGLIATFGIFSLGYLIRPLGGVIFGMAGDHFGRKKPFTITLFLMAFSTVAIGLIPTYNTIGIFAPMLLLFFRIIQGVSFGAEFPGSITFISEHVNNKYRGTHCAFMVASVAFGVTIGTFITYLLTTFLTHHQLMLWGWRLPFLLGGILALVGYLVRRKTQETPYFLRQSQVIVQKHDIKNAFVVLFKKYPSKVVLCFFIILFPACFIISYLCMPAFLHDIFNYKTSTIFLAMTIGYVWSTISLPFFGWLSDTVGRKRLYLISIALFIVFGWFLFDILYSQTFIALIGFMIIFQTIVGLLEACYLPMLPEIFPTTVRYTGIALCYNVAFAISSLIPIIFNFIYDITLNLKYIVAMFVVLAIIAALNLIFIKSRTRKSLLS